MPGLTFLPLMAAEELLLLGALGLEYLATRLRMRHLGFTQFWNVAGLHGRGSGAREL